jgi:hypothetical protein
LPGRVVELRAAEADPILRPSHAAGRVIKGRDPKAQRIDRRDRAGRGRRVFDDQLVEGIGAPSVDPTQRLLVFRALDCIVAVGSSLDLRPVSKMILAVVGANARV